METWRESKEYALPPDEGDGREEAEGLPTDTVEQREVIQLIVV